MQRNNSTQHYAIRFANGATSYEKCRKSVGGFANMLDRIGGGRHAVRSVMGEGDPRTAPIHYVIVATGETFTLEPVEKL